MQEKQTVIHNGGYYYVHICRRHGCGQLFLSRYKKKKYCKQCQRKTDVTFNKKHYYIRICQREGCGQLFLSRDKKVHYCKPCYYEFRREQISGERYKLHPKKMVSVDREVLKLNNEIRYMRFDTFAKYCMHRENEDCNFHNFTHDCKMYLCSIWLNFSRQNGKKRIYLLERTL